MKTQILLLLLFFSTQMFAQPNSAIERVEPPFWWTGMKESKLQLMVYGKAISESDLSLDYDGVTVEKLTKVENPNYLFVDLNIAETAKAGKLNLRFKKGKKSIDHIYELRAREMRENAQTGLDASDVVYLIMPDRFANGNTDNDSQDFLKEKVNRKDPYGRHGGDLSGLTQHLDYIADLGATAIWMTPFQENAMGKFTFHGYAMTDMYKVDPRVGTNEEYRKYVAEAHKKDLKVVIDVVFNQVGLHHWWMKDLPMKSWINQFDEYTNCNWAGYSMPDIHASEIDKKINVDGWFVPTMPDLDQNNELLLNYLIQWSIWWVEYANIDAIRFDTYQYNKPHSLSKWAHRLYSEYPEMYYCAEVWLDKVAPQVYWQKNIYDEDIKADRFPGMIDFPMNYAAASTFHKGHSINDVYELLTQDFLYLDAERNMTFLSNHDTDRFFSLVDEDVARMKMAMTLLLTSRGIPQLYYGEEILMTGLKKNGGDAQVRFDFPGGWEGDKVSVFENRGLTAQQSDFLGFMKRMLNWRKKNTDLVKGKLVHFRPENEVYVYFRLAGEKAVMVVMNNNEKDLHLKTGRFAEILGKFDQGKTLDGKGVDLKRDFLAKGKTATVIELEGLTASKGK